MENAFYDIFHRVLISARDLEYDEERFLPIFLVILAETMRGDKPRFCLEDIVEKYNFLEEDVNKVVAMLVDMNLFEEREGEND